MRKTLTILLTILFFISCANCQKILGIKQGGNSGIIFTGHTVVFFGNSITYGYNVDPSERWTTLFCAAKEAIEDNHGVNSMTMQNAGSLGCSGPVINPADIPTYISGTHAALFISLGINDCGWNRDDNAFNPIAFKAKYDRVIDTAINIKGWPANNIFLLTIYKPFSWQIYANSGCSGHVTMAPDANRIRDYKDAIISEALSNGCHLVDIGTAMSGLDAGFYQADQLHPDSDGHLFIANFLISTL